MSTSNQFSGYAKYYDDLYQEKSYSKELEQIQKFWKEDSDIPVKNVLSLGCGTATYEILLAKAGYRVVGVDISAEMLELGREKIAKEGLEENIKLVEADVRELANYGSFDAVIMMFNIAGYLHTSGDMKRLVENVKANLKPGGIFVFDAWYDQAVIADPPSDREKIIRNEEKKITRLTKGSIDNVAKLVKIVFEITEEQDGIKTHSVVEEHPMRYWGVKELSEIFEGVGLPILKTTSFMSPDNPISSEEWNMFVVAKK